jgi:hypothetical protein
MDRTWRAAAFPLLLAALVVACELSTDLSTLKDGRCPAGEKACFVDGSQQCVTLADPRTGCNAQSCLSCDVKVANAVTTCSSAGACTIAACKAGYIDCNKSDSDGCEVDVSVDVANCGLCGTVCAVESNSTPLCVHEACALACKDGFGDCDLKYSNGCEATLTTDAKNCGHCGVACAADQSCVEGSCR